MPSFNQIIIWAVIFLPFCAFVCLPTCYAFQAGLASARDSVHRVTPIPAWTSFEADFKRRIRLWTYLWGGALLAIFIWQGFFHFPTRFGVYPRFTTTLAGETLSEDPMPPADFGSEAWAKGLLASMPFELRFLRGMSPYVCLCIAMFYTFKAGCWLLAPRCRSVYVLLAYSLLIAVSLCALAAPISIWLFPSPLIQVDVAFRYYSNMDIPILVFPFYFAVLACLLDSLMERMAIHQGDKWFRFEE